MYAIFVYFIQVRQETVSTMYSYTNNQKTLLKKLYFKNISHLYKSNGTKLKNDYLVYPQV